MKHGIPANLHECIVVSACPRTMLTVKRVRRSARRARDYCRAYPAHEEGEDRQRKETNEREDEKEVCSPPEHARRGTWLSREAAVEWVTVTGVLDRNT